MSRLRPAAVRQLPADGPIPCPRRRCPGEIVEVDRAIRWNRLEVNGDSLYAGVGQSGDFTTDRFMCDTCLGTVTLPLGAAEGMIYT